MITEYKVIDGTNGAYGINEQGVIVRLKQGRTTTVGKILKAWLNPKTGYYIWCYDSDAVSPPSRQIHRLVAITFIPNPNNLPCVNHRDGNKLNNNVNNLEWCSYKQNTQHAISLGLVNPRRPNTSNRKLTDSDVADIIKQYLNGFSQVYLANKYNVNQCHISRIINKQRRLLCPQ